MAGLCAVAEWDAAMCTSVFGVALLFVHRRRRRRRYRQCTLKSLKFPQKIRSNFLELVVTVVEVDMITTGFVAQRISSRRKRIAKKYSIILERN